MGAYLSEPVIDKNSTDENNKYLQCGSSSMQGWRVSQEDAHNCVLNYDENTSLFAVYDGHGGAEVALYCADKLPDFLKTLQTFKEKNFENALKDVFIKFDATLLEDSVIEILKRLAGERNPHDSDSDIIDDDDDEDLAELCQEGSLPLESVLAKYKEKMLKKEEEKKEQKNGPNISVADKSIGAGSSGAGSSKSLKKELNDESVSSSSSKELDTKDKTASDADVESSKITCSADSSSITSLTNGVGVKSSETSGVSSSSNVTKHHENGVESKPSPSKGKTDGSNKSSGISSSIDSLTNDDDDSSSDSDADFQADIVDENSDDDDCEHEEDGDEADEEECGEEDEEVDEDTYKDDEFCSNMIEEPGKDSGCTAVVALLHGRDLYVANAGDSRCVVCRNGKAIEMSLDHKPEDEEESTRIVHAGGRVTIDGRVNGGLNLSRAIGDHAYKMNRDLPAEKQMISALPDIRKLVIQPEDEFMILACDGIWNYLSSDEVVEFIKERIGKGQENMSKICEELFESCLAPNTLGDGTGCDNMTAIIVKFKSDILNLPTTLNPDETITSLVKESITNETKSKKRTASDDDDCREINQSELKDSEQHCSKRLKTDDDDAISSITDSNIIDSVIKASQASTVETGEVSTTKDDIATSVDT